MDDPPRHYVGIAKKRSARALGERGLKPAGKTWAAKGKIVPVADRGHFEFLRTAYLPGHVAKGGVLWSGASGG